MKLSPWPTKTKRGSRSRQKQIQIYIAPADWLRLRMAAAREHRPMTALIRDMLKPALANLPEPDDPAGTD